MNISRLMKSSLGGVIGNGQYSENGN